MARGLASVVWRMLPGNVRQRAIKGLYNYLSRIDRGGVVTFLNYGYLPLTVDAGTGFNRSRVQLYHEVAGAVLLKGKDVLEISSGRGGGAAFVMNHYLPKSMTALDLSERAVEFCRSRYKLAGLSFMNGNAESLPFGSGQFDAVINIEASHNYGAFDAFASETCRVLKPGGHLLFADMRAHDKVGDLRSRLMQPGMELVSQRKITLNVVAALEAESDETISLINQQFPRPLRGFMYAFAGVRGTAVYEGLKSGTVEYWTFVLRKP